MSDSWYVENHGIDWEGMRLVARESQDSARKIREAIWITRTPNNMNRDGGGGHTSCLTFMTQ